jgi:hypothetical protein
MEVKRAPPSLVSSKIVGWEQLRVSAINSL